MNMPKRSLVVIKIYFYLETEQGINKEFRKQVFFKMSSSLGSFLLHYNGVPFFYSQILTNPLLVEGLLRPVGPALVLHHYCGSSCHIRWVGSPLCSFSKQVDFSKAYLIFSRMSSLISLPLHLMAKNNGVPFFYIIMGI